MVVVSGMGGCGKTEVVARVCSIALDRIYIKKKKEYDEYIRKKIAEAAAK